MADKLLFLLALTTLANLANGFEIKDCTAGKKADAKLIGLSISTCPDAKGDRCDFIKGQNATMVLDFEPTTTFSQANIKIYARMVSILIPFPLSGPTDACGNYGISCPVKVGDKDRLTISLPVLTAYPSIKTTVRFELNDENKAPIVCLEFPVQLKDSPSFRGIASV